MRPRKLLSCVALRVVFGDALASPIKTGIGAALISRAALLISFLVVIYFPTSFAQPAPILTPQISALAKPSASVLPPALSQACPHTGLAPSATAIASTRCPAASAQSCCGACADLNAALGLASASLGDLVSLVSPEALSFVQPNAKACDAFIGQTKCLQLLEDLTCALTCNPDAGAYVSSTAAGTAISVCDAFAQAVMEDCQGIDLEWRHTPPPPRNKSVLPPPYFPLPFLPLHLPVGEVSMSRVAPDPSSFMSIVAASVTSLMGAADVTITVDNTGSRGMTAPGPVPSSGMGIVAASVAALMGVAQMVAADLTITGSCVNGTGLHPRYTACCAVTLPPYKAGSPTARSALPSSPSTALQRSCFNGTGLYPRYTACSFFHPPSPSLIFSPFLFTPFRDLASTARMCDMFTGSQMCGQAIEDLLCAITCNPVGAVPLSALITSSESFLNAIAASVMKAIGYSNINIVVEKVQCCICI
ncbi:unnamed protein product [Closterium sp. NIES-65]|nr:unnamed protein product [Closterium sp. NIES-65]